MSLRRIYLYSYSNVSYIIALVYVARIIFRNFHINLVVLMWIWKEKYSIEFGNTDYLFKWYLLLCCFLLISLIFENFRPKLFWKTLKRGWYIFKFVQFIKCLNTPADQFELLGPLIIIMINSTSLAILIVTKNMFKKSQSFSTVCTADVFNIIIMLFN